MNTLNHIIIHIHKEEDNSFLRIIPVDRAVEYAEEFKRVYGVEEFTNYKCIYNCARWYDRLLDDLKYKKFRNINLQDAKRGLWIVKISDPSIVMEDFFNNYLYPYINLKLIGFQEDEEIEAGEADYLKKFLELQFEDINVAKHLDIKYCEANKDVLYTLKNADVCTDFFILTDGDIFAILLAFLLDKRSMLYFKEKTETKSEEDNITKYAGDFVLRKCAACNGFEINKLDFTTRQFMAHFNLLNINHSEYTDIPCKKGNFIRYVDKMMSTGNHLMGFSGWTNKTEGFVDWMGGNGCGDGKQDGTYLMDAAMLDCVGKSQLDDFGPLFDIDKTWSIWNDELKDYVHECLGSKNKKDTEKASKSNLCYVYYNIVSHKYYNCNEVIEYLGEYKLLHELAFSSGEGKHIFNIISDKLSNKDICKDLQMIMTVFGGVCDGKPSTLCTGAECDIELSGVASDKNDDDVQRLHTRNYVDKYKNDSAETLASHVIEKVYFYLSQHLQPQNINLNKIGQDLVQLGVKKTRKSKGNVYCINDPKKEELLDSGSGGVDSFVTKKNCQLRREPEIIVDKNSVGPWHLSSWNHALFGDLQ